MIFFIIGGVVAVVGVVLWILKGKKESKSAQLESTETSKVGEVVENFESLSVTAGKGNFTLFCELKGEAYADSPLKSELAGVECIYYSTKIVRKYEQREWKTDSDGNRQQRWRKKSDVVADNSEWANDAGLKDDSGFIELDPAKAELHTEKVHSSFERGEPNQNSALSIKVGKFSLGLGTADNDYRLIGYEQVEHAIKTGTDLYVIGDANDRDGKLKVSKPKDRNPFIISTESEDEIVSNLGSAAKGYKIAAYVCWALGVAGAIAGILQLLEVF